MGKILALDYGEKRIGIAVSDDSETVAFAKDYIAEDDYDKLLNFIKENEIAEIIVGYPISLSGNETEITEKVKQFKDQLSGDVDVPIWLIDERLSTKEVLTELKEMGQRLEDQKDMVDSFTAQKMLERYLTEKKK